MKMLPAKKSTDIDGISNSLLKFVMYEISSPIAHIFNISLTGGIYPEKFKTSRVVPIFKSGDYLLADNYRPIALINSIAKILDKIVAIKLSNHLDINKLLYKNQFGFRKNSSTELNLLNLTNFISSSINDNNYCIGIFLDLKKAFDVVSHEILLNKLKKFGISGKTWEWFNCYFTNRSQKVDINGVLSDLEYINISVLQGSVLGPILFLCFINDLYTVTDLLMLLFADDTSILASGNNLKDLIDICNRELHKIANWLLANKLAVNVNKCKFIIFHNKGKKIDLQDTTINFNFNEIGKTELPEKIIPLDRVYNNNPNLNDRTYKYLGILLDENFTLNPHFDLICNKLSKGLFCLNRAKNYLNRRSLTTLYYALFHPHLLYCSLILSCTSNKNLKRVSTLQKKALRTISNVPYNAHTTPLFLELKILPFEKILYHNKILFIHRVIHGHINRSFEFLRQNNLDRVNTIELRNNDDLFVPFPRYEGLKKFPIYDFPKCWNELGPMKYQNNPATFKIWLKNELFRTLAEEH